LRKVLIIFLFVSLTVWSCFDADPLHHVSNIDNGGIVRDTLYAISDTSIVEGKTSTAQGLKLLLGSHADFETRFLVRFSNLPADSLIIDSMKLVLTSQSNQGEVMGPITGSAYLITEEWEESVNGDESWDYQTSIDYAPETTAQFEVSEETSIIHSIVLRPAMMRAWQDTVGGDNNHGVLLDFDNASYIKEFSSRESFFSGERPKLALLFYDEEADSTYSDTLFANRDASLIDFNGTFDPEVINIVSGYQVRSFFEFDLSQIPQTAAMATMNLELKRDTLSSVFNNNNQESFLLRTVTSDFDLLPAYEVDSTFTINIFYSITMVETSDNVLGIQPIERGNSSQNFLQDIINGDIPYGSFLVHYKSEIDDVSVYSVKSRLDSNPQNRPMLYFEYYVIPEPRL
jgi:hypothetical protein